MLKKLMVTTAMTGFMIGAAAAEGTPPSPTPPAPPAATEPAPPAKSPAMTDPAPSTAPAPAASGPALSPSAATAAPTSSPKFVNSQRSDQFLASKFKGTNVIGSDDQKIGDVSDILFDKNGKIEAYVVGVGGFLGIGAKDVALAPTAFTIVAGDKSKNEADKLKVSMTKDELKQAANFEPYKAPSSTTGMGGPAGTTRPAPASGTAR
jgi:hypothetical protein